MRESARASAWTVTESPVGPLLLVATARGLCFVGFHAEARRVARELSRLTARFGAEPRPWEGSGDVGAGGVELAVAVAEMQRYAAGALRCFTVPLDWTLTRPADGLGAAAEPAVPEAGGGTGENRDTAGAAVPGFTERVLRTLRESVPYGSVVGYQELAARAGDPGAARAVGAAMGANPLPLVVACHRVVAADGGIGGFGGGLEAKRRLLALEGVLPAPLF